MQKSFKTETIEAESCEIKALMSNETKCSEATLSFVEVRTNTKENSQESDESDCSEWRKTIRNQEFTQHKSQQS
jgi:hypothetical protein